MYKENPKLKGSGIQAAIPQVGSCPVGCPDCFFQNGRSYLEPLSENLPNMPEPQADRIVRVNDGNDSNVNREQVIADTAKYPLRFFNTSSQEDLEGYPGPVVLTLNPGARQAWTKLKNIPPNLMFVRFLTNTWNMLVCDDAVEWYTDRQVTVVLTFMAYHSEDSIPLVFREHYIKRARTTNTYWAITTAGWRMVMDQYTDNLWVHSCGKIEGEWGNTKCRHCGNCHREFFVTTERMSDV